MYSLLLCMSMTTAADAPQGILFDRGGCAGSRVAATVQTVRTTIREHVSNRPHILRNIWDRRPHILAHAANALVNARAGCHGVRTTTVVHSAGCCGSVPQGYAPMPQAALEAEAGPIRRLAVHRTLKKALRSDKVPATDKVKIAALLADPVAYDQAVDATRGLLNQKHGFGAEAGKMEAIGDGHLLELLMKLLPEVLALLHSLGII